MATATGESEASSALPKPVLELTELVEESGQPGPNENKAGPPAAPQGGSEPEEAPFELTEVIEEPRVPTPATVSTLYSVAPPAAPPPAVAAADLSEPEPQPQPPSAPTPTEEPLLERSVQEAVAGTLGTMASAVRQDKAGGSPAGPDSPLEGMVRETLRPALKSWLDQNLPEIVERVVREEVRRLARRVEDA